MGSIVRDDNLHSASMQTGKLANLYHQALSAVGAKSGAYQDLKRAMGYSTRISSPAQCPQFYSMTDNQCKLDPDSPSLVDPITEYPSRCPTGFTLIVDICKRGSEFVEPTCPDAAMPMDGMCYYCDENLNVDKSEGHCRFRDIADPVCPEGLTLVMGDGNVPTCVS